MSNASDALAKFEPFGSTHLAALAVVFLVGTGMILLARARDGVRSRSCEILLGAALFSLWPVTAITHWMMNALNYETGLPFHYCDLAAIAGGVALWTRRQFFCEVVYFFGLAGTLQALITPALQFDFPDVRYFGFFIHHGSVVITSIYVVTALNHAPRRGAVLRMWLTTAAYGLFAAVINTLLGTNFGYVCAKPSSASLLDHLGAWPWYVGSILAVAVVFYSVLYLPFFLRARRGR